MRRQELSLCLRIIFAITTKQYAVSVEMTVCHNGNDFTF